MVKLLIYFTIDKYKIEFSDDNATPVSLDYNTSEIILAHVDYDTRKTFVDHVDYDMPETDTNP